MFHCDANSAVMETWPLGGPCTEPLLFRGFFDEVQNVGQQNAEIPIGGLKI
jgi:hypothetical protein